MFTRPTIFPVLAALSLALITQGVQAAPIKWRSHLDAAPGRSWPHQQTRARTFLYELVCPVQKARTRRVLAAANRRCNGTVLCTGQAERR